MGLTKGWKARHEAHRRRVKEGVAKCRAARPEGRGPTDSCVSGSNWRDATYSARAQATEDGACSHVHQDGRNTANVERAVTVPPDAPTQSLDSNVAGSAQTVIEFTSDSGLLSSIGYHVGKTHNLTPQLRRDALLRAYRMPLSRIRVANASEWGSAESPDRLAKIAHCLASFARLRRRSINQIDRAVREWNEDLAWLRIQFAGRSARVEWPQLDL